MRPDPVQVEGIAPKLAEFASGLDRSSLPDVVMQDATWRLSDCIGVSLIGARQEHAQALRSYLGEAGLQGPSTVIGFGMRVSAQLAGFANGVLAHGADYDDTHGEALLHISSVVGPAALAVAERVGASGSELMTAMIAGAEVGLRIASPVGHKLLVRGLHPTGIVGPFAAAATASRLLGLDSARTAHALGLAGSQAAGLRQGSQDGSWVKRLHSGWAAQAGITAAALAARGFTGPGAVLEGIYGLYAALLPGESFSADMICEGLGERWLYPETTYKPYPNGSWNHASMSAVAQIMHTERISYADIGRIDCSLPPVGFVAVCQPRDVRLRPKTAYHMKFSLPYSVAILTVLGHANADDYSPATLTDSRISSLAARVHCHADPQLEPRSFPARVSITTTDGRRFSADVKAQKGSKENPMTRGEHEEKFLGAAEPSLGSGQAAELAGQIDQIWSAPFLGPLISLVAARQAGGPTGRADTQGDQDSQAVS
jgi:2-methylcitrate dehydratase PrpD